MDKIRNDRTAKPNSRRFAIAGWRDLPKFCHPLKMSLGGLLLVWMIYGSAVQAMTAAEYVDQEFGLFIHFNMSTYTRQPFLSSGGEHEIGRMPTCDELGLANREDKITVDVPLKDYVVLHRMAKWTNREELQRGMFDREGKLTEWFRDAASADDGLTCKEYEAIREGADKFNPTAFNIWQWARAAQAAGVKYAILTTKHHGGFSLWDTNPGDTSDYDVAAATDWEGVSWKGDHGVKDIVRMFVEAFQEVGIKVGLYWSMPDRTYGFDGTVYNFDVYCSETDPDSVDDSVDCQRFNSLVRGDKFNFSVSLIRSIKEEEKFSLMLKGFDAEGTEIKSVSKELVFTKEYPEVKVLVGKSNVTRLTLRYSSARWEPPVALEIRDAGGKQVLQDTSGIPPEHLVQTQLKELLYYGEDDPIAILWVDNWDTRDNGWIEFQAVPYEPVRDWIKKDYPDTLLFLNAHPWDKENKKYSDLESKTAIVGFETNFEGIPPRYNEREAEVYNSIRANEVLVIEGDNLKKIKTDNKTLEFRVQLTGPSSQAVTVEVEKEEGDVWSQTEDIVIPAGHSSSDITTMQKDNISALRLNPIAPATIQVVSADHAIINGESLWFYHQIGDARLKSVDEIVFDTRMRVNNRKATYLLSVTPNKSGRIPANQVELLRQVGKVKNANALVDFDIIEKPEWSTDDVEGCPARASAAKVTFTARLTNRSRERAAYQNSGKVLSNLHVHVNELSNTSHVFGHVLLGGEGCEGVDYTQAEGGLPQPTYSDGCVLPGDAFRVPWLNGYASGNLPPGGYVDVPLSICLLGVERFTLFGDVFGQIDSDTTAPALIQSNFGDQEKKLTNFEMVVREGSQLRYWSRKNEDGSNKWMKGELFGKSVGSAPAIIQSNLPKGGRGNFEVVYREGNRISHYFRNNDKEDKKFALGEELFAGDKNSGPAANSAPAFIQNRIDGRFDLVYRDVNNQLRYWYRDANKVWHEDNGGKPIGENVTSAPALIQGSFDENLEVVVQEGDKLRHYWRDKNKNWHKDEDLFEMSSNVETKSNVNSAPTLIESDFGNFEVLVREDRIEYDDLDNGTRGDKIRRYWRDSNKVWHKDTDAQLFGNNVTSAPILIQSTLGDDQNNFEVVVREGDKLVHYYRKNDEPPEYSWDTSGEITE